MTRNWFVFVCLFCVFGCFGQSTKTGYRKIFLDENFAVVDSAESVYYAYGFFKNRWEITGIELIHSEISYGEKWSYNGEEGYEGYPLPLSGILKTNEYDVVRTYQFENGYLIHTTEKRDTSYYRVAYIDSLYADQPGTFYYEIFNSPDTVKGYFRKGKYGWDKYPEYDSRGTQFSHPEYPYWRGRIPAFVALVGGVEGFRNPGYEIGIGFNGGSIDPKFHNYAFPKGLGGMEGLVLSYKNRFDNSYYSLNAEFGAYLQSTVAMGYSYHSNGVAHKHTFKMTAGFTVFHLQFLYSYTFFRKSKNPIPELVHHAFTLRYALPVIRFSN